MDNENETKPDFLITFFSSMLARLSGALLNAVVIFLIIVAIIVGISRSLFPYLDNYSTWFETEASRTTELNIEIGGVEASWKTLHPLLKFQNVTVLDDSPGKNFVQIPQLQIKVNVIKSLIERRLVPESVIISGVSLSIHEGHDRLLEINGIKTIMSTSTEVEPSTTAIQGYFEWILKQGEITLDNVDIDWHGQGGVKLPLTNVQLKLTRGLFQHQIIGLATLVQKTPTKFRFVINLEGDLLTKHLVSATGYLHVKNMELDPWMKQHLWKGVGLGQGDLKDLKVWTSWRNDKFQNIQSQFEFDQFGLYDTVNRGSIHTKNLSGNIFWQDEADGWNLVASNLKLNINDDLWPLKQISFQRTTPNQVDILALDALNLADIANAPADFLSLNLSIIKDLQSLRPSGELQNVVIRRENIDDTDHQYSFIADIKNLHTSPWEKIPGISNLNGHINYAPESGTLLLAGENLGLDFNDLFPAPLLITQYEGQFDWVKTETGWQLQNNQLKLIDDSATTLSKVSLFIPKNKESPFISLSTAFEEKNTENIRNYIPIKVFNKGLSQWFDEAFIGGGSIKGQFLMHGPLNKFPYDDGEGRFELAAKIIDMPFNYRTNWPEFTKLNANVLWDSRRLMIDSDDAEILGAKIKGIKAEIPNLAKAELKVKGDIQADSEQGLAFIFQSPLDHGIGKKLKGLQMSGPLNLNLGLMIPFNAKSPPMSVNGEVELLADGNLTLSDWGIHLSDLEGGLTFTENTIRADVILASWIGNPLIINIDTNTISKDESIIQVQANGRMDVEDISETYALNFLDKIISGETAYDLTLDFINKKGAGSTVFSLSSDLDGLAITLPDPLTKETNAERDFHAKLFFNEQNNSSFDLISEYNKVMNTSLRFVQPNIESGEKGNWQFSRGEIRFGGGAAVLGADPGLRIKGTLSEVIWTNIADWLSVFKSETENQIDLKTNFIDQIDLSIKRIEAFGLSLNATNIKAAPLQNAWKINLSNKDMRGWFVLPTKDSTRKIEAEFDRLYLTANQVSGDDFSSLDPADLPPLDILLKDFRYGKKNLGKFYFLTQPQKNGLRLTRAVLSTQHFVINGSGLWQKLSNGRMHSTISGEFSTTDLGNTLNDWDLTDSLNKGKGSSSFSISWPGALYKPTFNSLDGQFSIDVKDGRILNISDSSQAGIGFGRILNLLSLQSIPKRLLLDFSDLSGKGFAFDIMKGDFKLDDGVATTTNMYLDGNVGKVELKGNIDLARKRYNLTMFVTPYLTESLPVVATIAGGPIAGVAAWLGQKVLGGVIDSMTSSKYRVIGPWVDPEISKY